MKRANMTRLAKAMVAMLLMCLILAMTCLFAGCGSTDEEEEGAQAADERTDEEIVRDAFENTFEDGSALSEALAKVTGDLNFSDATETTLELELTDGSAVGLEDFEGAGISLNAQSDTDSGESYLSAAFTLGSLELGAELYASADELSLGSNLLGSKVLTLDLTEDFLSQLEASPLFSDYAAYFDAGELTDISDSITDSTEFLADFSDYLSEFISTQEFDAFEDAVTVTRGEETEVTYDDEEIMATEFEISITIADAAQLLCDYVDYLFENEDFLNFLDQMISAGYLYTDSDYTSASEMVADWESVKEELLAAATDDSALIYVSIYDDRILSLVLDLEFTVDEEPVTFLISWSDNGKSGANDRSTQFLIEIGSDGEFVGLEARNVESSSGMTLSQETYLTFFENDVETDIELDITYDTEEYEFAMSLDMSNDEIGLLEFSAAGTLMGTADELLIYMDGITFAFNEDYLSFSLYFYIRDLEDAVSTPDGTKIDVLEADEDDLTLLYLEIISAVYDMDGLDDFLALFGVDLDDLFGTGDAYDDSDYDYDDDDEYIPETYDEYIEYAREILGDDYYEEYLIETYGEDYEDVLKAYFGES